MIRHNLPPRPPFRHPGHMFIERFGLPSSLDDIVKYADFLRSEAKAGNNPPIRLRAIKWKFGVNIAYKQLGEGMDGFVLEGKGQMIINSDRNKMRQRFTVCHEWIEFLYLACSQYSDSWFSTISEKYKEVLCQKGAAALLMPSKAFRYHLSQHGGISLKCASILADYYQVSLLAASHRIVDISDKECLLIVWNNSRRATVDNPKVIVPRVDWFAAKEGIYIPAGKSISEDSVIAKAFSTKGTLKNSEYLQVGTVSGTYQIEAKQITIEGKRQVISLLHVVP